MSFLRFIFLLRFVILKYSRRHKIHILFCIAKTYRQLIVILISNTVNPYHMQSKIIRKWIAIGNHIDVTTSFKARLSVFLQHYYLVVTVNTHKTCAIVWMQCFIFKLLLFLHDFCFKIIHCIEFCFGECFFQSVNVKTLLIFA